MQRARSSQRVLVVDLVTRPVRFLEERAVRRVGPRSQGLDRNVELLRLAGADDRNITVRAARDPRHGDMRRAHATIGRQFSHAARYFDVDGVTVEVLVDILGGTRRTCVARQKTPRQRTGGRDGDTLVPAIGEHLPLFLAI